MPEEDKNWLTGEPVSDSKIFFLLIMQVSVCCLRGFSDC